MTDSAFHDLGDYVRLPRLTGLTLSPDGTRLVTTVAAPSTTEANAMASALWEVDPSGDRPAHRLTRSRAGEAGAAFAADGDLYFTSRRPDPDSDAEPQGALWRLAATGGEAELVHRRPDGIGSVHAAAQARRLLVFAALLQGAATEAEHAELSEQRRKAKVDAVLHTGFPVRFWDQVLGPTRPVLMALDPADPADSAARLRPLTTDWAPMGEVVPRISPDGTFALIDVQRPERAGVRGALLRVDLETAETRLLVDRPEVETQAGPVSPDGRRAAVVLWDRPTPEQPPRARLRLVDTDSGLATLLAEDWERWPEPLAWSPDGSTVYVAADEAGRRPVFAVPVDGGPVRQITHDDAAWTDLVLAPDGVTGYGIRSSYLFPPEVVRLDLVDGQVTPLQGPATRPELPGRLEEVSTTAADGTPVRAWLALPTEPADTGHPLLLFVHGGPLASWNAWSWRWNPWLMVAQGYAVLLPDPALSTGYGQDFIKRGWGAWGDAPFTDLMSITDTVVARDDIDADRTAAMGGSFGGYMANWIAGHTDRFRAVVTHASLWSLDDFGPTSDAAFQWEQEMSPEMTEAHSPHRFVGEIRTPMLVIHGDRDYRVPIHEGMRLWYELLSKSGLPAGEDGTTPHRFLYFPNENHWIQRPEHTRLWYDVILGFLGEHVLDQGAPELPPVLGRTPPAPDPE